VPQAEAEEVRTAVLTVSDVAVRFGGVSALSDVSLTVQAGTVTGLIGPNGAGKTTLFNVISGLQTPGRGRVHIFDTDVTSVKPHRRAKLGLARTFQRLELFGTLSAGENVQVGLESDVKWWDRRRLARLLPGKKDAPAPPDGIDVARRGNQAAVTCDRLLAGVGLVGLGAEQASSMPTGNARMVELARALAIGPKLLLLDEPGSGLDEQESTALGDLLSKLASGGMAVLLVEHDMELVMRICDHIYVLDFGDIIASGPPDAIRRDPAVQAAYLGQTDGSADSGAVANPAADAGTVAAPTAVAPTAAAPTAAAPTVGAPDPGGAS